MYEPLFFFYCSCELCMTLKDISVALRRSLKLTPQHLPALLLKGCRERERETLAGVIHRGQWHNMLWVSTVAVCVCLLSLFPCVFVSTHLIITSLPAASCRINLLCLYRHQHVCVSLRKSKDREASSALSLPRRCWFHINTCILVWETVNVITYKHLQKVGTAFKCCWSLNFGHSELF